MERADIAALDHVGIAAPDLVAAALAYERLGFRLTPTARQSGPLAPGGPVVPWGSANRCAMLRRGYIELLGIVAPALYDNELSRFLARYAGIHVLALSVADAAAELRRLRAAGIATPGVRPLARPAGGGIARFKRLPLDAAPEGRIQLVEHETPELLWRPEFLDHPNRAVALAGTVLCVADLGEAAERFRRLIGAAPTGGPGTAVFSLAEGSLVLCDPSRLGAFVPWTPPTLRWFAALIVATDDGNAARRPSSPGTPCRTSGAATASSCRRTRPAAPPASSSPAPPDKARPVGATDRGDTHIALFARWMKPLEKPFANRGIVLRHFQDRIVLVDRKTLVRDGLLHGIARLAGKTLLLRWRRRLHPLLIALLDAGDVLDSVRGRIEFSVRDVRRRRLRLPLVLRLILRSGLGVRRRSGKEPCGA